MAAIKAKTDNLPSDPADASDITASFGAVNTTLGTIAGYTVEHDKGKPVRAIAIIDTPLGARTVAISDDFDIMQSCMQEEWIGRAVVVDGNKFSRSQ